MDTFRGWINFTHWQADIREGPEVRAVSEEDARRKLAEWFRAIAHAERLTLPQIDSIEVWRAADA